MRLAHDDQRKIRRLLRLPEGRPVLSVYLETTPGLALHHGHEAQLMDVLRDLRQGTSEENQEALSVEAERVLSFVREEYTPAGRTLVVFSSRPRRLFEVLSLQLPLPNHARFAPRPYMIPLELALEDYPRVAIALVGEEKARLITTVLGEIESERELKSHVPGLQRQGGWSAFRYQRDRERHVHENLVDVVRELKDLQKRLPCEWLVIAGADDVTSAMVKLLPRTLSKRLAGTFREEQFETSAEVVRRGALVAEEAERAEELQLSEQIRDMALARGNAVLGWDETFRALAEGRVHQLAVSASEVGSRDVDSAVQMALDTGARVEVVHDAAGEVLVPYRGIGALLRY